MAKRSGVGLITLGSTHHKDIIVVGREEGVVGITVGAEVGIRIPTKRKVLHVE